MSDPLLAFRKEFPILSRTIYLISNSLGAMPLAAADALAEYARVWSTRGVRAWGDSWWEMSVSVGDEIAPLLGAAAGTVAMLSSVTSAQACVLSSFDYRPPRDKIVLIEGEFPSVRYLYENLGARLGARIEVVASLARDGLTVDEERVVEAIDETTVLVSLSHVLFKSGFIVDLQPILEKARRVGAMVAVDGYQSVGTIAVDVAALGVPLYIGGVLKWLCGGPGAAFLYVDPDIRDRLTPAFTGWFSHKRPFAFEDTIDRSEDAHRFLAGTPAIPALYAAREGPRLVRQAGVAAIREKSIRQTALILERAGERGFRVTAPLEAARRGGTASFDFAEALEVSRELNGRDVCVDYRPGAGIRMSPHFYTSDEEIGSAFGEIDQIISSGVWKRWSGRPVVVT